MALFVAAHTICYHLVYILYRF